MLIRACGKELAVEKAFKVLCSLLRVRVRVKVRVRVRVRVRLRVRGRGRVRQGTRGREGLQGTVQPLDLECHLPPRTLLTTLVYELLY